MTKSYMDVEDLEVYQKLCKLHIDVCDLTEFRNSYKECIRMLNGLEKTLERKIPERERRWQISEESEGFAVNNEAYF